MQPEYIIAIYFTGVLLIGFISYFRIKTPEDYFIAGKKAGIFQVSGSLLATILGGSAILGTIELSQKIGWAALWFLFSASFGLFLLVPLSKYVKRFGNYTLPELLGFFYGKKARYIASAIIPLAWLGIVAAQIIAAAKILNGMQLLSYSNAAIISGSIFIIYTLAGGQISILKTDALQAIIIITGLASSVVFALISPSKLPVNTFSVSGLFNQSFSGFDLIILVCTYSVTFVVGPDIYSRVFCAGNEKIAKQSVLTVALLLIPVSVLLTYLGIYASSSSNESIISFAHHLLPTWGFGLFIAALLSAVMSSADTTLLTSSMIVTELVTGSLDKKNSLKFTRIIIVLFGILSIVISLFITSIIQSLLFALTFFSGAFVIPALTGLLRIKTEKKNVVYAIVTGGIIALTGKIIGTVANELYGNLIIISALIFNAVILFNPFRMFFNKIKK